MHLGAVLTLKLKHIHFKRDGRVVASLGFHEDCNGVCQGMNTYYSRKCFKKQTFCTISIPFSPFSSEKPLDSAKKSKLGKRQRILDLVTPKPNFSYGGCENHLRLIQEILPSNSNQVSYSNIKNNPILTLFQQHREGLRVDPIVLSQALSSGGCVRTASVGIQVHCLVIKTGYLSNVYVGSSMISLYSKWGGSGLAYQIFEEMPVRNVVSWTAIIAGFAQEWQVDVCLELYHRMRNLTVDPNDFTLASLLSACTGSGSLGKGKSAHCQAIQMGFDSYVYVSNALISMYFKCGDENEAVYIFKTMWNKDIVSWNSVIAGYAQHGFSSQAINLFEEMRKKKVRPNAITFLGVLSSCRHAGLVEQGQFYFNSMVEYGLEPEVDHYSCIVDLLGRAGDLEKARDFIKKMPIVANGIIWGSLLSSCRLHGNFWIGMEAAEKRLVLEPDCSATYLQLVNLYASFGCWDQVARVWKLMKDRGLKRDAGHSWIEIRNEVHRFGPEDGSNSNTDEIITLVGFLGDQIRDSGCVCELNKLEAGHGFDTSVFL